jgi:hypothetical protein
MRCAFPPYAGSRQHPGLGIEPDESQCYFDLMRPVELSALPGRHGSARTLGRLLCIVSTVFFGTGTATAQNPDPFESAPGPAVKSPPVRRSAPYQPPEQPPLATPPVIQTPLALLTRPNCWTDPGNNRWCFQTNGYVYVYTPICNRSAKYNLSGTQVTVEIAETPTVFNNGKVCVAVHYACTISEINLNCASYIDRNNQSKSTVLH